MKYKIQEEPKEQEKKGMNKELYEMFIDLIQFETDKLSFISSAKLYFFHNGYFGYVKFFDFMYKGCENNKCCLIEFLTKQMEEIPEFKIPALDTEFENETEPFEVLQKLEDSYVEKINAIGVKALELKDMQTLAYVFPKIAEIKHLACVALAAVKNEQNLLDLLKCE